MHCTVDASRYAQDIEIMFTTCLDYVAIYTMVEGRFVILHLY